MNAYIDGVVPQPMTLEERFFMSGMLIGNLRRIYAAHDDEGNDLSALPVKAADDIERLLGLVSAMIAHCEDRAKGWDEPKGKDHGDCEFGARHEARAIAAQLHEIADRALTPNVKWMAFSPCILETCHPSLVALQAKMAGQSGFLDWRPSAFRGWMAVKYGAVPGYAALAPCIPDSRRLCW